MIVVVDLGVSNVRSVERGFRRVGAEVRLTTAAGDVERASSIVLPGVGSFGDGMARLRELQLVGPLRAAAAAGTPVTGICLGMQLLADESEEHGRHEGLGLVPGKVVRLDPDRAGWRVPNIGWSDLRIERGNELVPTSVDGRAAYFVHSYHLECRDAADVAATAAFSGRQVTAAVERGNVRGVQFHPEKSQDVGLAVLATISQVAGRVAGRAST